MKPIGPDHTPFDRLGVEGARALAARFYDHMDANEPALVAVHRMDESKTKVASGVREAFALFLVEWLGGPNEYSAKHCHPRLRMRHAHVPVTVAMRDAWLRSMNVALAHPSITPDTRAFLEQKLSELAEFLRNQPE